MPSLEDITIEGILILVIIGAIGSIAGWFLIPQLRERMRGVLSELDITAPVLFAWAFAFVVFFSLIGLILIGKEVHFTAWFGLGFLVLMLILHAFTDSDDKERRRRYHDT